MNITDKEKLRTFLKTLLTRKGDRAEILDDQSLFLTGRLDSLAMTQVIVYLEQQFGISFAHVNFDVDMIDSINAIEGLLTEPSFH